jgi:hypothetical protein
LVRIDPDNDVADRGTGERLHDGPVSEDMCGLVDFVFEAVDQLDDNMFKILCRRIVNNPRGIGRAWRDRGGEESRCNGCANPVQQSRTRQVAMMEFHANGAHRQAA